MNIEKINTIFIASGGKQSGNFSNIKKYIETKSNKKKSIIDIITKVNNNGFNLLILFFLYKK